MRFHTLKPSTAANILTADSQTSKLSFSNFKILRLTAGKTCHIINFLSTKGQFKVVVLFIGANCLFKKHGNRVSTPIDVTEELSKLADCLVGLAEKVAIIRLTPQFTQLHEEGTTMVDKFLLGKSIVTEKRKIWHQTLSIQTHMLSSSKRNSSLSGPQVSEDRYSKNQGATCGRL